MLAHDTGGLWRYASAELDYANVALLEEHLSACPECREELDFIRATRLTLRAASAARPEVDWNRLDDALGAKVAKKMMRPGLGRWLRPVLVGALALPVALGIIAVLEVIHPGHGPAAPVAAAVAPRGPEPRPTRVSLATGTMVEVGAGERALSPGDDLGPGDRLRTAPRGLALVELPDRSLVRLAPSSDLTLVRAKETEISLKLGRGRVAIRAEHAPRRPFVVDAGGLMVRVVGTAFTVSSGATEVEVAVGEGTVLIEPELGQSVLLGAGKRMRFERAGWKARQRELSAVQRSELSELGVILAPAASSGMGQRRPAAVAGPGGPPPAAPVAGPVPMMMPSALVGGPPPATPPSGPSDEWLPFSRGAATDEPTAAAPAAVAPGVAGNGVATDASGSPAPPAPGATGGELPSGAAPPPLPPGVAPPDVTAAPAEVSPGVAGEEASSRPAATQRPSVSGPALPRDLEGLFLRRAEEALVSGKCERYELGLHELIETSESPDAREKARLLRARCFDATLRPADAEREYRLYLRDWPAGRWADEARGATEER